MREAIETLTDAAESRELNASGHGEMVARYSEIIARCAGPSRRRRSRDLAFAARVHDVGKIFVPERILNKPGPLTEDEFYLMKMHAHVGGEILATLPESKALREAVEHHHESFDGERLSGRFARRKDSALGAHLAITDAYVNMTTERSFAPPKTSEQALAELEKMSGTRYDGMLVRILMRELKLEKASRTLGN